jgi:uncharacterized protein (DUF2336 family)
MDLRLFEKTPQIAPLLVQLYESHRLYTLGKDKRALAKLELTGAVSQLLEVQLTPAQRELLSDVLVTLVRQAEKDLRHALSERLAVMENVPLRLVLQLANDEIRVAEPVLKKSPVLTDMDLIYIIKAHGPEYWQAIAAREYLSPLIIDVLADTRDVGTAMALSGNDRLKLTAHALDLLARMAQEHEDVARPLLSRAELPERIARQIYEYVGTELRSWIDDHFGPVGAAVANAVNDIIVEFTEQQAEYMPTEDMMELAQRYASLNMLSVQMMMDVLQKGQIASFIAFFARYTGLPVKRVHDFLKQNCPKGMAIACRAFGVQKPDFSRIYLLTHRMRSASRTVNHEEMLQTLLYFDKVRPEVAKRIVMRTGAF